VVVVLDSNVRLSAIGPNSPLRYIWNSFLDGAFKIAVNQDILTEYEEILQEHAPRATKIVMDIFEESIDVLYQRVSYNWDAIKKDRDDNKFFDVAVASSADYLVTNDKHFNVAKKLAFPKIIIVTAEEFIEVLTG